MPLADAISSSPKEYIRRILATPGRPARGQVRYKPRVKTAIISDLHLGALSGSDVLRDPEIRAALLEEVRGADGVVRGRLRPRQPRPPIRGAAARPALDRRRAAAARRGRRPLPRPDRDDRR